VQAVRDYTDWKTIPAQIIKVDDLQARHISAAENLRREDLSAIEEVDAIVEFVDAEPIGDKEYALFGSKPANRVKKLLGKLHSATSSKNRGSKV
jgi:ParB-like chromosome segregation protein Spo0J